MSTLLRRPSKLSLLHSSLLPTRSESAISDGSRKLFSEAELRTGRSRTRSCSRESPRRRSVSLLGLLHPPLHSRLSRPRSQIPLPLSHSGSLSTPQETMLMRLGHNFTVFSTLSGSDSDEDSDENEGDSSADPKEADRVCKVIDELFTLDRNMESVLDECGIRLSRDLVVEVLERFKHARKPAFRFFCWAREKPNYAHDSRTYNKMMSVLAKTRQFETMVSMIVEMGELGFLTMDTFVISIKAFCAAKERKKAYGVFELMKKHEFKVDVEIVNCLLDALGRAKLAKEANLLFEKIEGRLFVPNLHTYTVLLNGWCKVKNLVEAGKLWNVMTDLGFVPDVVAHNVMIEGLLKAKKRSDAIKLFTVMKAKGPNPNIRSFTVLIRDFCKQGKMNEAIEYFDDMVESGIEPDIPVYTCLISGFGNKKNMDMVYNLLKEMKNKGCEPDGRLYNALIKLMTSQKMSDDAMRIYKRMTQSGIKPTIHTYNMIMKSFFATRNFEMGRAVWTEMFEKGFCPDENSYVVLIGGLIRQGRAEEACEYLEEMLEKGMKAPQLDYCKFASDFSRVESSGALQKLALKMRLAGKFEVANMFFKWAEMMNKKGLNNRTGSQ